MPGILVVDDHPIIRKGVRRLLDLSRLQVCGEAADGYEAIDQAMQLRPDIVVLDIQMPKLNGIEAARQIQQLLPATKIVFLSSHSQSLFSECNSLSHGFVSKATAEMDLVPTVMELLGTTYRQEPNPEPSPERTYHPISRNGNSRRAASSNKPDSAEQSPFAR
jgi:DNA-binding NarL/FixJ family response regulator